MFSLVGCASEPIDPQQEIKDNMQVMREAISKTVVDNKRRQVLLDLSMSLEITLALYNQKYTDFAIQFGKLNRKYDTPRSELESLLNTIRKTRKTTINEVMDIHFKMVANTTGDEWKKIVKKEVEAIKSVRQLPEDKLGGAS